jgi:hypothetical protein
MGTRLGLTLFRFHLVPLSSAAIGMQTGGGE